MKSPPKRTPSPPVLKYLLAALRPYPVPVFLLLGTIVFDSLFDTAIPVVLSLLLDQAATQRNLNLALFLGGGLAGGWLVSIGSQFSRDYLYAWVTSRVLTDLRVRVEAHLHERDFARLRELRPSDVSGALGSELARIENLLLNVLPSFLFAALYLLFSLVAMAGTDLRLATFVLVLLPLAVLGPRVLGHRASAQEQPPGRKNLISDLRHRRAFMPNPSCGLSTFPVASRPPSARRPSTCACIVAVFTT